MVLKSNIAGLDSAKPSNSRIIVPIICRGKGPTNNCPINKLLQAGRAPLGIATGGMSRITATCPKPVYEIRAVVGLVDSCENKESARMHRRIYCQ